MTTRRQRLLVSAYVALACCVWLSISAAANAQNLVGNPGFENGNGNEAPWVITGNCWTDPHTIPYSSSYYLAFGGANTTPNGTASQTITTIPATSYRLSFWHGINVWNQSASQKLHVTISGMGTVASQSYVLSATANMIGRAVWVERSITFVANSASTTIQFADDASNPTINTDLMLEDVSMIATGGVGGPTSTPVPTPTPTPSGWQATDTDNDVTVTANGYVTTFHGGRPYIVDENNAGGTYSSTVAIRNDVTVTTISGEVVPLGAGLLFVDKNGDPVSPGSIQPGTRMQAIEVVDQVDVGLVVQKIMVDQ